MLAGDPIRAIRVVRGCLRRVRPGDVHNYLSSLESVYHEVDYYEVRAHVDRVVPETAHQPKRDTVS